MNQFFDSFFKTLKYPTIVFVTIFASVGLIVIEQKTQYPPVFSILFIASGIIIIANNIRLFYGGLSQEVSEPISSETPQKLAKDNHSNKRA